MFAGRFRRIVAVKPPDNAPLSGVTAWAGSGRLSRRRAARPGQAFGAVWPSTLRHRALERSVPIEQHPSTSCC